jgi:hypothetical protein
MISSINKRNGNLKQKDMKRGKWVGKMIIMGLLFIAFLMVLIAGTQSLWNWLVPGLFGGPMLTFWQMAGLLLLTKIILWPLGGRHSRGYYGGPWKYYWKEKWANMSPAEREKLKQKMKEKWCYRESSASADEPGTSNG